MHQIHPFTVLISPSFNPICRLYEFYVQDPAFCSMSTNRCTHLIVPESLPTNTVGLGLFIQPCGFFARGCFHFFQVENVPLNRCKVFRFGMQDQLEIWGTVMKMRRNVAIEYAIYDAMSECSHSAVPIRVWRGIVCRIIPSKRRLHSSSWT